MALTFGPTGDGKYIFPADDITFNHMRTELRAAKGDYKRKEGDKGNHYVLPYATQEDKAATNALHETWKQLKAENTLSPEEWTKKFNAEHPYAFTGALARHGDFFKKMGARGVGGPDNKFYAWEFRDEEGKAPAAERAALAKAILTQDLETLHAFSPESSILKPDGTTISDRHAFAVRNALGKPEMGQAMLKQGEQVIGRVFAPNEKLDLEEWRERLAEIEMMVYVSANEKGPDPEKQDQILTFIMSEPLLAEAAGIAHVKSFAELELLRLDRFEVIRNASKAYTKMVSNHDRLDEIFQASKISEEQIKAAYAVVANPEMTQKQIKIAQSTLKAYEAYKANPVSAEQVSGAEDLLIKGDDGKIMRTLAQAAVERMDERVSQATTSDVTNLDIDKSLESKAKNIKGESRVKEGAGTAYDIDEDIKKMSKKMGIMGMDDAQVVNILKRLSEGIDGAELEVVQPTRAFVAEGPVVAFNKDFIVQAMTTTRNGVQNVTFMQHPREQFLDAVYPKDGIPAYTDNDYKAGKVTMYNKASEGPESSLSAGHILKTRDDQLQKLVESGQSMLIGAHAGVYVALKPTAVAERNGGKEVWDTVGGSKRQDILVNLVNREVEYAQNGYGRSEWSLKNLTTSIESKKHLKPNATVEETAKFEEHRENLKASSKDVMEKAKPILEEMYEKSVEAAKAKSLEGPAVTGVSAGVMAHVPAMPDPLPTSPMMFAEPNKPVHGHVVNRIGDIILVEEFSIHRPAKKLELKEATGKHFAFNLGMAGPGLDGRTVDNLREQKTTQTLVAQDNMFNGQGELTVAKGDKYEVEVYAKRKSYGKEVDAIAVPVTIGYVTVDSSFSRLAIRENVWETELHLKEQYERTKSKAQSQDKPLDRPAARKERESGIYSNNLRDADAKANSDEQERLKEALRKVQTTIASDKDVDINRVVASKRIQNPKYTESEAFNDNEIYGQSAGVNHPLFQRDGMVVMKNRDELPGGPGKVEYTSSTDQDQRMQNDGLVVLSYWDAEARVQRVVPLEKFEGAEFPMAYSEDLTASGNTVSRALEYGDTLDVRIEGLDADGRPMLNIEIVDNELKMARDKKRIQDHASERMTSAFGMSKEVSDEIRFGFKDRGFDQVAKLKPLEVDTAKGHYEGVLVPMGEGKGRWVALVENADSYLKQGGQLQYRAFRDADMVEVVHQKDARGEMPYLMGGGTIVVAGGKPKLVDAVTKADRAMKNADAAALEEARESIREGQTPANTR